MHILMIDDEVEYLKGHASYLQLEGFEVTRKSNLDEALHLLGTQTFDLITLDLLMPAQGVATQNKTRRPPDLRRTGLLVHQEIRLKLELKDTPIIFMSVLRDEKIRNEIIQFERQFGREAVFLAKPVRPSELIVEINRALGIR
ncbi:MAG: response regulator [Chloroflexi bacterium]|nr:response regulator [Chloroflexota bacterium]